MKILIAELGDAVQAQGGIEKVVANMANAMAERGHDVTVMIFDRRQGELFYPLSSKVKFLNPGAGVHINRMWVNISNIFYRDRDWKEHRRHELGCRKIAEIVRPLLDEIKPDVIISHEYKSVRVFKGLIGTRIPVISFFHLSPENWLANKYFRPAFEKVECINVLLPGYIEELKQLIIPQKVVSIPIYVVQYDGHCNCSAKKIINVARIDHRQKRQKILIEAFARICKDFPGWTVEFWGDVNFDKSYFEELQQTVKKYNLQERVKFCGSTKDVPGKLRQASVFAFPSSYEGFPSALAEAMAMGLPSVGFKKGIATNQIIHDGSNGILTDDGYESFAAGLRQLMGSEDLRRTYGQQAKKDMERFTEKVVWDRWEQLLSEVVYE